MKKTTAALGAAVVLASAGFAIGSQSGDGSAIAGDGARSGPAGNAAFGERRDRGLERLAERLGVEAGDLRAALEELRDEQERPERPDFTAQLADELGIGESTVEEALREQRPDRRDHRDRHAAFTRALAEELGLSRARVRAALRELRADRGARRDRDGAEAALADALGVSAERLREAVAAVHDERGPSGRDLTELADAMGVEADALEAALEKLREQHEAEHEQRRAAFAEALADKLGIEQSTVEEALEEGGPFGGHRGFGGPGRHHGPR